MMPPSPSWPPWKPPHLRISIHTTSFAAGLQRAADATRGLLGALQGNRDRLRAMHTSYRRKTARRKP